MKALSSWTILLTKTLVMIIMTLHSISITYNIAPGKDLTPGRRKKLKYEFICIII